MKIKKKNQRKWKYFFLGYIYYSVKRLKRFHESKNVENKVIGSNSINLGLFVNEKKKMKNITNRNLQRAI